MADEHRSNLEGMLDCIGLPAVLSKLADICRDTSKSYGDNGHRRQMSAWWGAEQALREASANANACRIF